MKSLRTSFVVLFAFIVCMLAATANAQTIDHKENTFYSEFYVMQVKSMRFRITYHYPMSDRVKVRILDGTGNTLFVESALVHKKYEKNFDLGIFKDGKYTFELTDGAREYFQSFDISTRTERTVTFNDKRSIEVTGF
jgi:hypothetical protein